MTANGKAVPWHRDDVNIFEFHVDVPQGVSTLDVAIDFISPPDTGGFSSGSSITSQLAVLSWNQVLRDKAKPDLIADIIRPHTTGPRPASGGSR